MISLKRREDRREWFEKTNPWLEFEYFWGIDAKNRRIPFIKKFTPFFGIKDCSLGSLGATLSHRKLLKLFLKMDCNYIAILEDDVFVKKEYFEYWTEEYKKLDFDFLFLGAFHGLTKAKEGGIKYFSAKFGAIASVYEQTLFGAYGYIVSKNGAKKFLKATGAVLPHPHDHWGALNKNGEFNYLCVFPNTVIHSETGVKSDTVVHQALITSFKYAMPLKQTWL